MTTTTTLALLDRWLAQERAEAARCRSLNADGHHSAAADAAEREDRARLLAALRDFARGIEPGDRPHAVTALRGSARGQRHLAHQCADVATLRERYTAQAERIERVADALAMLAREVGR